MAKHQPTEFGANLRRLREKSRLTQDDLSAASGISRSTIATLETGSRRTSDVGTVLRLAAALGASTDDLLGVGEKPRTATAGVTADEQKAV